MPFAPVDDRGTVLQYEDTGVPNGSAAYKTLILIHGIQFNAAVFKPLIPFAAPNNLRLVFVNLRSNGGSTPYNDEEIKAVTSGDEEQQAGFVKERVLELSSFLAWFLEKETIPIPKELGGKREGGFTLHCSCEGCHRAVLDYVYHIILDPPYPAIGARHPSIEELYNMLLDPKATNEEKAAAWIPKLVGNYSRTGPNTVRALSATSLADLPPVQAYFDGIQTKPDPITWDLASLDAVMEPPTSFQVFFPLTVTMPPEFYDAALEKALTDGYTGSGGVKYFPQTKFEFIACSESLQEMAWAAYWVKEKQLRYKAEGKETREFNIHVVEGVSHAWHWLEPENALKYWANLA
ncbi:hypothetical protein EIP91_004680 [Steccherinum ochraceum]|uniref:AB hydrolase-1 domain-containing protein n=1 Tax=Steccherinum ochraceum TaxID=92696 RepID=A0A4R0R949_9APHY|nr:hypothetical protein EIP91_004680 [Steccherinum ochraceum]